MRCSHGDAYSSSSNDVLERDAIDVETQHSGGDAGATSEARCREEVSYIDQTRRGR